MTDPLTVTLALLFGMAAGLTLGGLVGHAIGRAAALARLQGDRPKRQPLPRRLQVADEADMTDGAAVPFGSFFCPDWPDCGCPPGTVRPDCPGLGKR